MNYSLASAPTTPFSALLENDDVITSDSEHDDFSQSDDPHVEDSEEEDDDDDDDVGVIEATTLPPRNRKRQRSSSQNGEAPCSSTPASVDDAFVSLEYQPPFARERSPESDLIRRRWNVVDGPCLALYLARRWFKKPFTLVQLSNDLMGDGSFADVGKPFMKSSFYKSDGSELDVSKMLLTTGERYRRFLSVGSVEAASPSEELPPHMAIIATRFDEEERRWVAFVVMHLPNGVLVHFDCSTMELTSCDSMQSLFSRMPRDSGWTWTWIRTHPKPEHTFYSTLGHPDVTKSLVSEAPAQESSCLDREQAVLSQLVSSEFGEILVRATKKGEGLEAKFVAYLAGSWRLEVGVGGVERYQYLPSGSKQLIKCEPLSAGIATALYGPEANWKPIHKLLNVTDAYIQKKRSQAINKHGVYNEKQQTISYFFPEEEGRKPRLVFDLRKSTGLHYWTNVGPNRQKGTLKSDKYRAVIKEHRRYPRLQRCYAPPDARLLKKLWSSLSIPPENVRVKNIPTPTLDEAFPGFSIPEHQQRVYLLKGDMGTGKTQTMRKILENIPEQWRVLVITHRRSLSWNLANEFRVTNYLKQEGNKPVYVDIDPETPRLCVSINSLRQIPPYMPAFDVVIIDEIEGVLQHLVSKETMKSPVLAQDLLEYWIKRSRLVLAADANLSPSTGGLFLPRICQPENIHVFINTHRRQRLLKAYRCESLGQLRQSIAQLLTRNQKIPLLDRIPERFVFASNILAEVNKIYALILKYDPERCDQRVLRVTSETMQDPNVKAFLQSPNTEVVKYDYLLYSPSISSGISITQPHFHRLYCYGQASSNSINELDQMLWRIRVFVGGEQLSSFIYHISNCAMDKGGFSDETKCFDHAINSKELRVRHLNNLRIDRGFIWGSSQSSSSKEYTAMCSRLISAIFRDRLDYSKKFDNRMRERGLDIHSIVMHPEEQQHQPDLTKGINATIKAFNKLKEEERYRLILNAPSLTEDQAAILRAKRKHDVLSLEEVAALERYNIAMFYYGDANAPISRLLLKQDKKGERREGLTRFAYEQAGIEFNALQDSESANSHSYDNHQTTHLQERFLAFYIMSIYDWPETAILTLNDVKAREIATLLDILKQMASIIGFDIRCFQAWPDPESADVSDVRKFFKEFLKRRGLDLVSFGPRTKVGSQFTYKYQVRGPTGVNVAACIERVLSRSKLNRHMAAFHTGPSDESAARQVHLAFIDNKEVSLAEISDKPLEILWETQAVRHIRVVGGYLSDGRPVLLTLFVNGVQDPPTGCYRAHVASDDGRLLEDERNIDPQYFTKCLLNLEVVDGKIAAITTKTRFCQPSSENDIAVWSKETDPDYSELHLLTELCVRLGYANPDTIQISAEKKAMLFGRLETLKISFRGMIDRRPESPFFPCQGQGRHWEL